ncbi:MAG: sigma factor-like helix-turn-helix DNA-binding protein, partial [bacterium]|nr:sigma factor-like helix-turn-helix DNA-binding protein [bacterium]
YTRYHCLHQINKNNGWYLIDCRDADSLYKNIAEKTKPDHTQSTEYIYHVLGKLNDKRILDIFKLRYSGPKEKMTFREIGRSLGVSGQTVLNLYNKGKKILKEKLVNGSEMDIV